MLWKSERTQFVCPAYNLFNWFWRPKFFFFGFFGPIHSPMSQADWLLKCPFLSDYWPYTFFQPKLPPPLSFSPVLSFFRLLATVDRRYPAVYSTTNLFFLFSWFFSGGRGGNWGCLLCAFNSLEKKKIQWKIFCIKYQQRILYLSSRVFLGGEGGLLANKLSKYHI